MTTTFETMTPRQRRRLHEDLFEHFPEGFIAMRIIGSASQSAIIILDIEAMVGGETRCVHTLIANRRAILPIKDGLLAERIGNYVRCDDDWDRLLAA